MKSGSLEVSRILMVFLYLFIYGAQSSRSDDGADFLLNLIGRLQAQHGQSPGEANANNEGGEGDDDDEDEEDDEDSDDESDMENYEYEEGPTIFDPYGEEEDDDEAANNGEDEEYSDGLPRVGHNHDENYDESAESEDEMMMDFFEDDFVINDRANAMDPVLLVAAAKNKLVPIERKGTVRRRDESQHEDEVEINESASPNKRRKLDDGYVDDKSIKRSNRDEYNDILPALMGDGNNNGDGGDGKRDDKKFNDIWNGNKSKSPKNRPNKDNKNNNSTNSNNNNNNDDDMPALVEDIDDDELPQNQSNNSAAQQMFNNPNLLNALLAHRHTIRNRNSNSNDNNRTSGSDEDMPILIESDDEDEQPQRSSRPIEVNDDEDDLPELTSEEESDDDEEFGFRQMFPNPSCPVHGGRPTCCEYHAQHGFSTDEDNSDDGDYDEDEDEDEDEEMHDHDHLISAFHNALAEHFTNDPLSQRRPIPQRTSQPSSASSSLRQESPFLRGGASPTVSQHLHNSSASVPGRKRRRADRDHEEYNEDYEVDVNKPVDVPPLVWSDDEGDEEDHEAEEISSDSEQVEEQTPEQKERFQRFLMANLTNAIMSNYLHTHDHEEVDSDDDDDEYLLDEDEDEEVVQSSPPFSFVSNQRLVQPSQAPRANDQGGFQFNFDQPFNPAVNRQGEFQFAPMPGVPQNMSFNFTQTSNNSVGPVFNFTSGQVQHQTGQHSVNITWNYSSNNSNGAQNNTNPHDHTDFDPNSLHDVD